MNKLIIALSILCSLGISASEWNTKIEIDKAVIAFKEGEGHLKKSEFEKAANKFINSYNLGLSSYIPLFLAADLYSKAGKIERAFAALNKLVESENLNNLLIDFDNKETFKAFKELKGFSELYAKQKSIEDTLSKDALDNAGELKVDYSNVENFYLAFDIAKNIDDGQGRLNAYKRHYFSKASEGMMDYVAMKFSSINRFIDYVHNNTEFYESNRKCLDILKLSGSRIQASLKKLLSYSQSETIPPITYIVGYHTSGGTVSESGMLLGYEFLDCSDSNKENVRDWVKKSYLSDPQEHLWTITHEFVHSIQNTSSPHLLANVLVEGGADFLANMTYGMPVKPRQYTIYGRKHHARIMTRLKKELKNTSYEHWTGNNSENYGDDWAADLGYYAGHVVVECYYRNMEDKKQAIKDLLSLTDYDRIWRISGVGQGTCGESP